MTLALGILSTLATIGGTTAGISAQRTAAKRTKSQTEQAERVRAEEKKRAAALVAEAEALPTKAAETAAIAAGKKKRRRATIATGPRGLLGEPTVVKPTLLGA